MKQKRYKDEHGNFYWKFDRVVEVETEIIEPETKPEPVKKPVKKRR